MIVMVSKEERSYRIQYHNNKIIFYEIIKAITDTESGSWIRVADVVNTTEGDFTHEA